MAASLPVTSAEALSTLDTTTFSYRQLDVVDRRLLAEAYLSCIKPDIATVIAVAELRTRDALACLVDGWKDQITTAVVAESIATGGGLTDLSPAVLDAATATAVACWNDPAWWHDELFFDFTASTTMTEPQADCAADAYLNSFGVERAIRRRLLTLTLLTLSPADQQTLDLPSRCGLQVMYDGQSYGASRGVCIAEFGNESRSHVVDCDQAHNAEVTAVHSVAADYPSWPGIEPIRAQGKDLCRSDFESLGSSASAYAYGWGLPSRRRWEADVREIVCVLLQQPGQVWNGPSGLVA